jgi:hypothetical protein
MPKFNNRKTTVDGHVFDSKLEASFYQAFKVAKDIKILELQPTVVLAPPTKVGKKAVLAIKYISDFLIEYKGKKYLVDSKGVETAVFKIKMNLFKRLNYPYPLIVAKTLKEFVNDLKKPS